LRSTRAGSPTATTLSGNDSVTTAPARLRIEKLAQTDWPAKVGVVELAAAVSVEVCAVVLLKVSEVEERLHVGSVELVEPDGRVVTAQVSEQVGDAFEIRMPMRPDTRLQMIAADDVGSFVTLAFGQPDEWIGRELEIAGDELTMTQIADVVGVHETTVSRAVSGKYMQTPQGIFEMKYFFTAGIQTANANGDGGMSSTSMSNTSVKNIIDEIFKAEDNSKPLSDQEVVRMLKEKGIVIARRTVAKYRTELNILPSNLRKVY